ncbi:MAG: 3-keto-5-aminohexanoate cleavage protein [Deltaproteobacteria bacterium]|nr:3-keto-5-aminohexanoate cleavage protein [Deltaproteobacteria bacterium]
MSKAVITAAITGSIHTPTMSPYLPITPDQIADNAIQAYEAGAAVAHIHVRNPQTGQPSPDPELFKEVLSQVKSKCDMIICTTTGGGLGMTPEQRLTVVSTFKPELASFNMGSMNFGLFPILERMKDFKFPWEKQYLEFTEDLIFPNTFKSMRIFLKVFNENGTKPELEVYDAGMVDNVAFMIQSGLLKTPVYLQFVLGILGGMAANIQNLVFLHESACRQIGEKNFVWSVCAAGINQMPMCTTALLMGGNARVGMEDALRVSKGVLAKNNAELVEKIVRIAREFGLEPATPAEARKILGLKGLDKVAY